jgi:hypothetical protein
MALDYDHDKAASIKGMVSEESGTLFANLFVSELTIAHD